MRHYVGLGPTPAEEACAQVGQPEYQRTARAECRRFIALLRHTLGTEPAGAELRIKRFEHDFGTYLEVVCWYDARLPASMDYAFRCEIEAPKTWEG